MNNKSLIEKLESYNFSEKEFSTIQINGSELNMWMIKPADFDDNKKYSGSKTKFQFCLFFERARRRRAGW